MRRVAFTIVLNGLHHINHNDYVNGLAPFIDHWVFVDGASSNTGSTQWCEQQPDEYHNNGSSVDGTVERLEELKKTHKNITLIKANGLWNSKDDMVNAALNALKGGPAYLWQIDIDEQWQQQHMNIAELRLDYERGDTGMFHCDYYVGKELLARGEFGEGCGNPWRRLWRWDGGRLFTHHEPPMLEGTNRYEVLLPQRFHHYSYYFEHDIIYKEKFYGYQGLHSRWLKLQHQTVFPRHAAELMMSLGILGSDSWIHKDKQCA